jgi:hypothetical protein
MEDTDASYTPSLGFEDAYEITTSGDYHVRSLSSGRTMKINPAGWVILRDPDTRSPVRVHVSRLRPSNGHPVDADAYVEAPNAGNRGRTFQQLLRLFVIIAAISVFIRSRTPEGGDIDFGIGIGISIKESLRQRAISWLQYLLEWLEGEPPCVRMYCHHPWWWADDLVQNHSL